MAWQEIERKTTPRPTDPVSLGVGKLGVKASLRVAAAAALGWKPGDKLRVFFDAEASKLKFEKSDQGTYRPRFLHKGGCLVLAGYIDGISAAAHRNLPVRYVTEGCALIVDLPANMRAAAPPAVAQAAARPQTPPARAVMGGDAQKPAAARVTAVPLPARPLTPEQIGAKVDVSNRFFNDPKPPIGMTSGVRGQR